MADAKRDNNRVPTLLGVSSADGITPIAIQVDPTTGAILADLAAGAGDVTKVGTPLDNQVAVWTGDGTIEGTTGLTYDGSNFQLTGDIGATGARITKGWFADLEVTNAIAGSITGNAATVTTITGLAPDTATTQATQASITTAVNLVTVGTIGTGTWEATDVAVLHGGTGSSTASGALSNLGGIGAATTDTLTNKTFDANGTGNSLSNVDVADLANGTDGELITWSAAAAPTTVATGTADQVLTSNGAGAAPTFQDAGGGGSLLGYDGTNFGYTFSGDNDSWAKTNVQFQASGTGYVNVTSNGASYRTYTGLSAIGSGVGALDFSQSVDTTAELGYVLNSTGGDKFWGFAKFDGFETLYTATNKEKIGFSVDTSTLYATTCSGSAVTNTSITATVTNFLVYKTVWNPSTDVKFYVDNTLEATHTTNIPTTVLQARFGTGGTDNSQNIAFTPIYILQEV